MLPWLVAWLRSVLLFSRHSILWSVNRATTTGTVLSPVLLRGQRVRVPVREEERGGGTLRQGYQRLGTAMRGTERQRETESVVVWKED